MKRNAKTKRRSARSARSSTWQNKPRNLVGSAAENRKRAFETGRQWFHILFGGALLMSALFLGPRWTQIGYLVGLLMGLIILHFKLQQIPIVGIDPILARFERRDAVFPGQGALMYFAGALFVLSFTPFHFALAVISIVAFGDGFATLIGLYGKRPLPWNPRKSMEGLFAFILSAVAIASLVVPPAYAIAYSVMLGLLETVDLPVDDNLILPVAATILYFAMPFAV